MGGAYLEGVLTVGPARKLGVAALAWLAAVYLAIPVSAAQENVRADPSLSERMAAGMELLAQGRLVPARAEFAVVLTEAKARSDHDLVSRALWRLGDVSIRLTEPERALSEFERAIAAARRMGSAAREVNVMSGLARVHYQAGQYELTLEVVQRQVQLAGTTGELALQAECLANLGAVYHGLRRYVEARDALERAVEGLREHGQDLSLANALTTLGGASLYLRELSSAADVLEEAIDILRELGNVESLPTALGSLARVHRARSEPERARELAMEALAIIGDHVNPYAECWVLGVAAMALYDLGHLQRTRELFARRGEVARDLADRGSEGWALWGEGLAIYAMGDTETARRRFESARDSSKVTRDELLGLHADLGLVNCQFVGGSMDGVRKAYEAILPAAIAAGYSEIVASAYSSLGALEQSVGQFSAAEAACRRGVEFARQLGGSRTEISLMLGIARSLQSRGRTVEARELADEALRLTPGELLSPLAEAHLLQGSLAHDLGDFERSRVHFETSLSLVRRMGSTRQATRVMLSLADLTAHLRDRASSAALAAEALESARQNGWRQIESKALAVSGWVRLEFGDPAGALPILEASLALSEELGIANAAVVSDLSVACLRLGQVEAARAWADRRLALARNSASPNALGWGLLGLGKVELAEGELDRAREHFERAEAAFERGGEGPFVNHPVVYQIRVQNLAGHATKALELVARAETGIARQVRMLEDVHEAADVRSTFSLLPRLAQDAFALAIAQARDDDERAALTQVAYRSATRWKGRALLHGIAEHHAGARTLAAIELKRRRRQTLDERDKLLREIATDARNGLPSDEIDALRDEIDRHEARAQELAVELKAVSPGDAALEISEETDPAQLAAELLDRHTLLVEYAEGLERVYAFAISIDGVRHVDLGQSEEIVAAAEDFVGLVGDPSRLGDAATIAARGGMLYRKLLEPLLRAHDNLERLIVIPSASLTRLPFEALVVPSARPVTAATGFADLDFVLDRFELTYAPSSGVLLELKRVGPREERGRVLLLADPLYESEAAQLEALSPPTSTRPFGSIALRAAPSPKALTRLLKTRDEALTVAALLTRIAKEGGFDGSLERARGKRSVSVSGELFDLHLGAEASVDRLAGDLRGYFALHFAAHGFVDRESPHRTGIALTYSADESGFFTVADALELDLDAELTVLSACDTAAGPVRAGEGVQSLARAFLYAGSRSVVASLWQVADWAAAETMQAFYRAAIEEGMHPAAALRAAKQAMRNSKAVRGVKVAGESSSTTLTAAHPYAWAPFVYIGLPH